MEARRSLKGSTALGGRRCANSCSAGKPTGGVACQGTKNTLFAIDQPHHLAIAPGLTLQPAARLHPFEIAIDIELQKDQRVVRRPAGCLRIYPVEPKLSQIEFVDKNVDHPNRIVLADPVFHAFRKQRALPTIRPSTKRFI
jgi:hypothetical protein